MTKKKAETMPWDVVDHFQSEKDRIACLDATLEDGDPALIAAALGDIARAKGMTQVARETGPGRESLYQALSPSGNPEFTTTLKVLNALGFQFHVQSAQLDIASD